MAVKDRFIKKEEFMRLLFTKIDGVDTYDLSMWLKSKTDDEFVVVPREFCILMVSFLERQTVAKEYLLFNPEKVLGQIEEIKRYL